MPWIIEIETASPDDGIEVRDLFQASMELLGNDVNRSSLDDNGWLLQLEIEPRNSDEALAFAAIRIAAVCDLTGLPEWPFIAVRALDAEYWIDQ